MRKNYIVANKEFGFLHQAYKYQGGLIKGGEKAKLEVVNQDCLFLIHKSIDMYRNENGCPTKQQYINTFLTVIGEEEREILKDEQREGHAQIRKIYTYLGCMYCGIQGNDWVNDFSVSKQTIYTGFGTLEDQILSDLKCYETVFALVHAINMVDYWDLNKYDDEKDDNNTTG